MQVAGGKEVYYEKPGDTVLFNADLFHRSGEAYPGTVKMAVHWVLPEELNGEGASASGVQPDAEAANEVQDDSENFDDEEQTQQDLNSEAVESTDDAFEPAKEEPEKKVFEALSAVKQDGEEAFEAEPEPPAKKLKMQED